MLYLNRPAKGFLKTFFMNIIKKLLDYLHSSKNELSKVTWPSKQETIRYSTLVIVISLGAVAFFGIIDYGLNQLVNATLSNVQIQNQEPLPKTKPIINQIKNNLSHTTSTPTITKTANSSTSSTKEENQNK